MPLRDMLCHNSVLRSCGQIFLVPSSRAGILFLIGIGINSLSQLLVTLGAVFCALFSNLLLNRQLHLSQGDERRQGLYGYNAALIALAVSCFYGISTASLLCILITSCLSSVIISCYLNSRFQLPAFTAPFILSTWLIMLLADSLGLTLQLPAAGLEIDEFYTSVARGIGQVLFQDDALTGLICLAGLLSFSRVIALWAVIGSAIGVLLASFLSFPDDLIYSGIYSFNAVLAGIALAQLYPRKFLLPLCGIIGSILLTRAFHLAELISLTAPFVISSWLVILAASRSGRNVS